jgi:hypothetical protein
VLNTVTDIAQVIGQSVNPIWSARALALTLFMTRITAYNPHDTLATDNLAVLANALHGCFNFHPVTPECVYSR